MRVTIYRRLGFQSKIQPNAQFKGKYHWVPKDQKQSPCGFFHFLDMGDYIYAVTEARTAALPHDTCTHCMYAMGKQLL